MPIPPAFLIFVGPKAGIVAKAVAYEYLPAVSSAAFGAILSRLAWKRLPDWIKEDVSFRRSKTNNGTTTATTDVERLSTVLEKILAWVEEASKQLVDPVPYPNAAFLIYWQLVVQQEANERRESIRILEEHTKKQQQHLLLSEEANEEGLPNEFSEKPVYRNDYDTDDSSDDDNFKDNDDDIDFHHLQDMMTLATLAYYLDDDSSEYLEEQLETQHYDLKTCFVPSRPGSVGYFIATEQKGETAAKNEEVEVEVGVSTIKRRQTLLIGVRGTASLQELLTDACGRSVSYHGPDGSEAGEGDGISNSVRIEVSAPEADEVCYAPSELNEETGEVEFEVVSGHQRIWVEQDSDLAGSIVSDATVDGGNDDDGPDKDNKSNTAGKRRHFRRSTLDSHVRCHEGILVSTKRLFAQVRPIIEEYVVRGEHRLLLVGHSLGASACCLLAMMLRSKYPELVNNNSDRLHVYAFAPPPVMDHDTAIGASSYVTSVVHESDLITRCSLANLSVFLEVLRTIASDVLIPNGLAPTGAVKTAAFLKQLSKGDKGEPFWYEEELDRAICEAQAKVEVRDPDHLYVPGKLYFLEAKRREGMLEESLQNPNNAQGMKRYSYTLTDGTAPPLRVIEMNGYRMLGDHTTSSYEAAIASLVDQQEKCKARSSNMF